MDDAVLRGLIERLNALESGSIRYRMGEVTDDDPLTIDLGASGSVTGASTVGAMQLEVGDVVAVLRWGHDMLVLGKLTSSSPINRGVEVITVAGGTPTGSSGTINHGLGGTPTAIVATADRTLGVGSGKIVCTVGNIDSDSFDINVRAADNTNIGAGDVTVYWVAIL